MSALDRQVLPVRSEPIATSRPGPAVWLVGAHGGAGVSTLAQYWGFAEDSGRQWPCGTARTIESPYVVVVCRETTEGLARAHDLILEHRDRTLNTDLLGLVTIANGPGSAPKDVRQRRSIVAGAVGANCWSIGWHRFLVSAARVSLPTWNPLDGIPTVTKGTAVAVPADVIAAGVGIITTIQQTLPALWSDRH